MPQAPKKKVYEEEKTIDIDYRIEFTYSAIREAQETIRFTDAKSGTVIVFITAFLTALFMLINEYKSVICIANEVTKVIIIIGSIIFGLLLLAALYFAFKSINPSNNPNDHIVVDKSHKNGLKYFLTGLKPTMRLRDYFKEHSDSKFSVPVSEYYSDIKNADFDDVLFSLSNELVKVSYIRDKKYHRTKCSIRFLLYGLFSIPILAIVCYLISVAPDVINFVSRIMVIHK